MAKADLIREEKKAVDVSRFCVPGGTSFTFLIII